MIVQICHGTQRTCVVLIYSLTVVFSSEAQLLWPPYTSTKAINVFLFFFFLLFVTLFLRYLNSVNTM